MAVDVFRIMDDICAWLKANGIRPADVPIKAVPTIARRRITCPVYLSRDGRKYLDETGEVARGVVTVRLRRRPPAVLRPWLGLPPQPVPLAADGQAYRRRCLARRRRR